MAKVIPREQLANMQPVKLAAFDRPGKPLARGNPSASGNQTTSRPPSIQEIQASIELARETARKDGFLQGQEEGRKAGYEAGVAQAAQQMDRLNSLFDALDSTVLRQDEEIAHEMLELVLTVTQQILRSAIQVKPDIILTAIREAMLALPSLEINYRVIAHPDDTEIVREWIRREHAHLSWEVMEDPQMQRGGFRIESAHSELDATMETRWQQVIESLGADLSWLDNSA